MQAPSSLEELIEALRCLLYLFERDEAIPLALRRLPLCLQRFRVQDRGVVMVEHLQIGGGAQIRQQHEAVLVIGGDDARHADAGLAQQVIKKTIEAQRLLKIKGKEVARLHRLAM